MASFASKLARVAGSLAVTVLIVGGFVFLVAASRAVMRRISQAQGAVELKAYSMLLILSMMLSSSRQMGR